MSLNDLTISQARLPAEAAQPLRERSDAVPISDHTFVSLLRAYRAAGGLARREELDRRLVAAHLRATPLRCEPAQPDHWMHFAWRDIRWWPLFQFDAGRRKHPAVAQIVNELNGVLAVWELAQWFVTPNDWLGDELPILCFSRSAEATIQAARADRFIAAG